MDFAAMTGSPNKPLPSNVLQEYLEALAETDERPGGRRRHVLFSYAELQFRLHGGGRCAMCRSAVRHVMPVRVERADGSVAEYSCLCTRCLEGEKALAARITLSVGKNVLEYNSEPDDSTVVTKSKARVK